MEISQLVFLPGLFLWISILLLPWRPWCIRESLDSLPHLRLDLSAVTVLIPARNEARNIQKTLSALKLQGDGFSTILVDDRSDDDTINVAESVQLKNLNIIKGDALPESWSGKLWALEQGRLHVTSPYILLLDADIVLKPGLISTLLQAASNENIQMLSLMAKLRMESTLEKLLMPAFIFFFKLLYPFRLVNGSRHHIAAAAGGCILLKTNIINQLGGFSCIKNTLIDDCSLAKKVKQNGYRIWIGLTHSAVSVREYTSLSAIWQMVTRTAYTQLHHSVMLLMLCTLSMMVAFLLPLLALLHSDPIIVSMGLLTIFLQMTCYLPCLRYYTVLPFYGLSLPFVGITYLIMTWHSALHHYVGRGVSWKDRYYQQ